MVDWSLGECGEHGSAEKAGVGTEGGSGDEGAAGFAAGELRGLLEAIDVAELAEGEVHLGREEIPGGGDATADDVEREVERVDEGGEATAEIAADLGVDGAGFAIAGLARARRSGGLLLCRGRRRICCWRRDQRVGHGSGRRGSGRSVRCRWRRRSTRGSRGRRRSRRGRRS